RASSGSRPSAMRAMPEAPPRRRRGGGAATARSSCRQEDAGRRSVRTDEAEGAAEERVVPRRDIDQVEAFEDRDSLLEQRVMGGMLLVPVLLDAEAVDPDQTELPFDEELRAFAGQVDEIRI